MVINESVWQAMVQYAQQGAPNETCGVLGGTGKRATQFYPIDNVDDSPVHYRMDPQQQLHALMDIDERDCDLVGIYHSHTHTPAVPSQTDISLAAYPDALYVIVSLADQDRPEVRAYAIVDGKVTEHKLEVVGS